MEPLHDRDELRRVLDMTRRTCAALAGGDAHVLVVIDGLCAEALRDRRAQRRGRASPRRPGRG